MPQQGSKKPDNLTQSSIDHHCTGGGEKSHARSARCVTLGHFKKCPKHPNIEYYPNQDCRVCRDLRADKEKKVHDAKMKQKEADDAKKAAKEKEKAFGKPPPAKKPGAGRGNMLSTNNKRG